VVPVEWKGDPRASQDAMSRHGDLDASAFHVKRLVAEIRHCCDAIVDRESRPGKADRASTAVRDLWVE